MCGFRVLNAEVNSTNRSLAVVLGGSGTVMMCFFMNFSTAFIIREVRVTGLRSFIALTELLLVRGTTVECFYSWETVPLSMDC